MLIRTATLTCALAVSFMAGQSAMAQCDSPACGSGTSSCDGSTQAFGSTVQADWDAFKQRFKLDSDRNAAWPHPFLAADRQAYRDMFKPCYDRGWEIEHTLSDACFDNETGRINRLGAAKVAQLVHTAPNNRKTLFVHQSDSAELAASRMKQVETYIREEFGRSAGVSVAVTQNFPVTGHGTYAENVSRQWHANLPKPVLQASSVSSAVGGGGQ